MFQENSSLSIIKRKISLFEEKNLLLIFISTKLCIQHKHEGFFEKIIIRENTHQEWKKEFLVLKYIEGKDSRV